MRMAEVQRRNYLSEKLARLFRRQTTLFHKIIEQFTAGNVLQHQIEVLVVFVNIREAKDVRMIDQFHYGDFSFHLILMVQIILNLMIIHIVCILL